MTHIQWAAATIILGLLVAIGWGVFRVLRQTSFVASIIARNIAEAEDLEDEMRPQVIEPQDIEEGTRPIGFGAHLRERN